MSSTGLRKPNEITREKITFSRNKMGQLTPAIPLVGTRFHSRSHLR
jgi:hypothetical protein